MDDQVIKVTAKASPAVRVVSGLAIPTVTTGDLGSGKQLTSITAGGLRIAFRQQAIFSLVLFHTANRTKTTLTPADFPTSTISSNAAGVTLTFSNGLGTSVVLPFAYNAPFGTVDCLPSVNLGTDYAATRAIYSLDVMVVPEPPEAIGDCSLATCKYGGEVIRNPVAANSRMRSDVASHPGLIFGPDYGGFGGTLKPSAEMGFVHFYGITSRQGLMVLTDDVQGRGKYLIKEGLASATRLGIRFLPENNRLGTGVPFTAAYRMVLRPMRGEWWDSCVYYSRFMQAKSHPAFARGRLTERLTDSNWSALGRDMRIFMFFQNESAYSAGWSLVLDEARKVATYYGLRQDEAYLNLYGWETKPLDNQWPDFLPVLSGAASMLSAAVSDTAFRVGLHFFINGVHPQAPQYSTYGFSAYTLRDDVGLRLLDPTLTAAYPPATPDQFERVNIGSVGARNAVRDGMLARLLAAVPGICGGVFYDTWGASGPIDDHNTILTAGARGAGSAGFTAGKRALVQEFRTILRTSPNGRAGAIQHAEGPDEFLVGELDFQTIEHFTVDSGLNPYPKQPMFGTAFGPWTRMFTFDALGAVLTNLGRHAEAWLTSHSLHWGMGLTLLRAVTSSAVYAGTNSYFPLPSSPLYSTEMALNLFRKLLFVDFRDAVTRLQRGQRLRELPGSYQRKVELDNVTLTVIADAESGVGFSLAPVTEPALHSSVWLTREYGDLSILVVLTNWKDGTIAGDDDAETFTISMTDAEYPWLAGRTCEVVEIRKDGDGDAQRVGFTVSGWQQTVTLAPRTMRVWRIKNVGEVPSLSLV